MNNEMNKNDPKWTIKLMEVARFKFQFPMTRTATQVAEVIGMTKTNSSE